MRQRTFDSLQPCGRNTVISVSNVILSKRILQEPQKHSDTIILVKSKESVYPWGGGVLKRLDWSSWTQATVSSRVPQPDVLKLLFPDCQSG